MRRDHGDSVGEFLGLAGNSGETDRARVAKARADISMLATGIERLRLDLGRYPTEEEGLDILRYPPGDEDEERWHGPYLLKSVPKDPWRNPYRYMAPAPNGIDEYGIESLGRDGEPGGEEHDKDINSWTHYDEDEGEE